MVAGMGCPARARAVSSTNAPGRNGERWFNGQLATQAWQRHLLQVGYTDRLLSDYPNMYGDLSAGSGLNALTRDEDFARDFLIRHRDRLLFGSDCNDRDGGGDYERDFGNFRREQFADADLYEDADDT